MEDAILKVKWWWGGAGRENILLFILQVKYIA